jgi:hypothetical protein
MAISNPLDKRDCYAAIALGATLVGCSALNQRGPHATINDVALPAELRSEYTLGAVDGKPVERLSGVLVTHVPYAVVAPGKHTFTLEPDPGSSKRRTTISAKVEAGKHYRLVVEREQVVLAEDVERALSNRN